MATPGSKSSTKLICAIIAGILYAIILIMAIVVNMETNESYAEDKSYILFWVSTVLLIPLILCGIDDLKNDDQKKKAWGFVAYHAALWLILILLPFGQYPKLSTILFMGAILSIASLKANFKDKAESDTHDIESLKKMSKLGSNIITLVVVAILATILYTKAGLGPVVNRYYNKTSEFIKSIGDSSPKSEGSNVFGSKGSASSDSDTYYPEDEKPNQMTATVSNYAYPLDFGSECPIMTNATVTVNFGENIVNAKINFKRGNITIEDGTVDNLNEDGFGSVSGSWRQSKTGLSGSYKLTITGKQTGVLILYSGDTRIATIDLYSSPDV